MSENLKIVLALVGIVLLVYLVHSYNKSHESFTNQALDENQGFMDFEDLGNFVNHRNHKHFEYIKNAPPPIPPLWRFTPRTPIIGKFSIGFP